MPNLKILTEAYRGKRREFPEIEKHIKILLDDIREETKIRSTGTDLTKSSTDFNNHPSNKKIEELLEKSFKCKGVNIYWKPAMYNACTVPPLLPGQLKLNKGLDNDSMVADTSINVYIGIPIVTLTTINEKEMMAIILHEIGHCHSMSPILWFMKFIQTTIALPLMLWTKFVMAAGVKVEDFIRKHAPIVYNAFMLYKNADISIMGPINRMLNVSLSFNPMILRPEYAILMYGHYVDEKTSDSFATTFGYGPYLISSLEKLDNMDNSITMNIVDSNNITRIMYDTSMLLSSFMSVCLLEPHPSLNVRYHNCLRQLKEDLKDPNLDPKYRTEMLAQIKQLEDSYDTLGKLGEKEGIQLRHTVNKFIDSITNNKADIRELDNKSYSDKYRF